MKLTQQFPIFAQPISVFELKVNSAEILKILAKAKWHKTIHLDADQDKKSWSTHRSFLTKQNSPCFSELLKEITAACHIHTKDVIQYVCDLKLTSSWGTKTQPEGFSSRHYHANSWISGVYYPHSSPSYSIRFHNPRNFPFNTSPTSFNIYNSLTWTVPSATNRLLLFDSMLEHAILKNTSSQDRYSIAFNLLPAGPFGRGDSKIE